MARVIVLSGSGISAESGISTFRGNGGLWDEYHIKDICNYDSLDKNEALTIEFYDKQRLELETKKPNYAHKIISKLKKEYKDDISVITQNIDDLFEKAGLKSDEVIHLHGFITEVRCQNTQCNLIFDIGYKKQKDVYGGICPSCQNKLRPNVVFFGEATPLYDKLYKELESCELIVIIGTSGNVINTDSLVSYVKKSILNNLHPSNAIFDELYSKVIYLPATQAISEIEVDIRAQLKSDINTNGNKDWWIESMCSD